jgi:hypothetical protein
MTTPKADRFERALLYVVLALGQVNVTKLEKILYLADLEHFHRTGITLTGARWVRYKLGPLAKRLIHARDDMAGYEIRVSGEIQGDRQAQVYRPGPSPRFEPSLGSEEQRDLDRIITLARAMNSEQMIRFAYNTSPMRFLLAQEQGSPRYNVRIPFELDLAVVARHATEEATADPESRRAFKLAEFERSADLAEATLARVGG